MLYFVLSSEKDSVLLNHSFTEFSRWEFLLIAVHNLMNFISLVLMIVWIFSMHRNIRRSGVHTRIRFWMIIVFYFVPFVFLAALFLSFKFFPVKMGKYLNLTDAFLSQYKKTVLLWGIIYLIYIIFLHSDLYIDLAFPRTASQVSVRLFFIVAKNLAGFILCFYSLYLFRLIHCIEKQFASDGGLFSEMNSRQQLIDSL